LVLLEKEPKLSYIHGMTRFTSPESMRKTDALEFQRLGDPEKKEEEGSCTGKSKQSYVR